MEFLPFSQIDAHKPCAVVDSRHPAAAATLSHWRGAAVPEYLRADTSTEIVLRALGRRHPSTQLPYVSNNHFDIDGCLGVWSLIHPSLALANADVLTQAALIGDFREYDPAHPAADLALKLVCWINHAEKRHFYVPFGDKQEAVACLEKYAYFLPLIANFLKNQVEFKEQWQGEYQQVKEDLASLEANGTREMLKDIRLLRICHPRPLHYYALFHASAQADMVLMQFSEQRYELEYKYSTWVDTTTRSIFPRLSFGPLAARLNARENSALQWQGQSIMDTGPSLRLGGKELTKAARFAHPFEREIHSSSIDPESLMQEITRHYREAYAGIETRTRWTWAGMRSASERRWQAPDL